MATLPMVHFSHVALHPHACFSYSHASHASHLTLPLLHHNFISLLAANLCRILTCCNNVYPASDCAQLVARASSSNRKLGSSTAAGGRKV